MYISGVIKDSQCNKGQGQDHDAQKLGICKAFDATVLRDEILSIVTVCCFEYFYLST